MARGALNMFYVIGGVVVAILVAGFLRCADPRRLETDAEIERQTVKPRAARRARSIHSTLAAMPASEKNSELADLPGRTVGASTRRS